MSFAHPLALLFLLVLAPIVLLYRLRVRVPSRTVATGQFWEKALAEEKVRWQWRRWRTKASMAFEMLIVALIVLAAAGPQIPSAKRTVLLLDNSATMRATDVQPTRLDAAKETARRLIGGLRWCDEMAVVAVGPAPVEIQPMTNDQALMRAAIESVQPAAEPAAIELAVKLAQEIAASEKVAPRIMLISDACGKEAAKQAQESGVEILRVGSPAANLAITCFTARRSKADPTKCEALVEVCNQGNQSAQGSVTISVDTKPGEGKLPSGGTEQGEGSARSRFSIVKDGLWQHVFSLDLSTSARLTARISPGDAYVFDDTAVLDAPPPPAVHRVKFSGDEGSRLKEILAADQRVDLGDDAQSKAIQVVVGKTPEELPPGPVLIFNPAACDLWQVGKAVDDPLVTRVDDSSVLSGVQLFDAYLPDARQLQIAEPVRAAAKPILWAGALPLGYAIDRPQGRVVVIAGDLAASNLAMQAGFPQLIGQLLDWLAGQPLWKDQVIAGDVERGAWGRGGDAPPGPGPADHGSRAGVDIRVPAEIGSDASALAPAKPWPPLWIVPAALAAVLLAIEWCLYQRRWTS